MFILVALNYRLLAAIGSRKCSKGNLGGASPLRNYLPLLLDKGKGTQGIGLMNNFIF